MKATFAMASGLLALAVLTSAVHASGSNFPYSNCNSNNFDTSFFIESLKLVDSSGKTNDYLLTIGQAGCIGTSPCCGMDVHKVKFHIYEKCKHSIGKIVVTTNFGLEGKKTAEHSPTFQSYGPDMFTFKVSQLGWTKDTAYGSTILFQLKKDSACPDKTSFFVDDNVYSIGNEDLTCCPVWDFAALYNPSGTIYNTA